MLNNTLRKALGMKPKSETMVDPTGKVTVTDYFPDYSPKEVAEYQDGSLLSLSRYKQGQLIEKTDYPADGSKLVSVFSNGYSHQTKINADGSIAFKDRLCSIDGKPITKVFSGGTRKTTYITAYVNGFKLGEPIDGGYAYNSAQDAESVRQNTLYNAANRAIAKGDKDELEAISAQVLKQRELLDNPQFQSLVASCYEATKAAVPGKNIRDFQADFHKRLEASGYQQLQPQGKINAAFERMRSNLEKANDSTSEQKPVAEKQKTGNEGISPVLYPGKERSNG